MLEVGTNSYITTTEADEYISSRYRSNNKDRKRWEELSESDKEILLVNACDELERLPWIGRRASRQQTLSFPRLPLQYGRSQEPPQAIKHAQAELALWLSDDTKQANANQRQELQSQGVTSFGIGDLSESYTGNSTNPAPMLCSKVAGLIAPYINGGHSTC